MISFAEVETYLQGEFNDTSTATQTFLRLAIRQIYNEMVAFTGWNETDTSKTAVTVGSQNYYALPADYRRMIAVKVTVGTVNYFPQPLASDNMWYQTQGWTTTTVSDFPIYYRLDQNYLYLYPTPSSNGNTITHYYYGIEREVVTADFTDETAGTVAITTATTAVTGSGTTFLAGDAGKHILMPDGLWYKIASFTSTTSITLAKAYQGATVSGGSYRVGRLPVFPSPGDMVLIYGVLERLWAKRENSSSGPRIPYGEMYRDGLKQLRMQRKLLYDDARVNTIRKGDLININNYPLGLSS